MKSSKGNEVSYWLKDEALAKNSINIIVRSDR